MGVVNRNNLYAALRKRKPMEDVIEEMRQNITIAPAPGDGVQLTFRYENRDQAKRVAEDLAESLGFVDGSSSAAKGPRAAAWIPIGLGLLSGVLVGLLRFAEGRRVLVWSLAGAAVVYTVSWLIPSTYVSSAFIAGQSARRRGTHQRGESSRELICARGPEAYEDRAWP
jgi:hypothetical protein